MVPFLNKAGASPIVSSFYFSLFKYSCFIKEKHAHVLHAHVQANLILHQSYKLQNGMEIWSLF